MNFSEITKKIEQGGRISASEAIELFSLDLTHLGRLADLRRSILLPGNKVGFVIDRIINYSNICEARCAFCAFHARAGLIEPYELTRDEIFAKIDELIAIGGTQVMLQGGLDSGKDLSFFTGLVSDIKERYPAVYLHSFSPAEISFAAKVSGVSVVDGVRALRDAGLDSVPGASDLLVDSVRSRVSPLKPGRVEWREVILALADCGMGSTATMTFGMGEGLYERIEHLEFIRSVQDETGILRAFIPWSFSPRNTALSGVVSASAVEYLRVVAVSRIFLDNIPHIHSGWLTEGLKVGQLALAMGADDMGGVLMEERVVRVTGIDTAAGVHDLVEIIRGAGRIPVLRDSEYNPKGSEHSVRALGCCILGSERRFL